MDATRERLQVADAARLEWEEATAAKAEAASQARSELKARGPAHWDEHRREAQAAEVREVQADEPGHEIERAEPAAEAQSELEATATAANPNDHAENDDIELEI
jgi:hypothetical protein